MEEMKLNELTPRSMYTGHYVAVGKLELEDDYEDGPLLCPYCGGNNLHQTDLQVFPRDEDSVSQYVAIKNMATDNPKVIIQEDTSGQDENPSGRHQGILLSFECESNFSEEGVFHQNPLLAIYQHKGCTFMNWVEKVPEKK
jgi:hypothetical protein